MKRNEKVNLTVEFVETSTWKIFSELLS